MSPETLTDAVFALGFMTLFTFLLAIGGFVIEYVLPRFPALNKLVEKVTGCTDEDDGEVE